MVDIQTVSIARALYLVEPGLLGNTAECYLDTCRTDNVRVSLQTILQKKTQQLANAETE